MHTTVMLWTLKFIGNFIWKTLGGFVFAFFWFALGAALSLTVIGYPLGLKCFKIGYFIWKPFGKIVVLGISGYPVSNILWGFTIGLATALAAMILALSTALTVLGLPLAFQWFKVVKLSLFPFGAYVKL